MVKKMIEEIEKEISFTKEGRCEDHDCNCTVRSNCDVQNKINILDFCLQLAKKEQSKIDKMIESIEDNIIDQCRNCSLRNYKTVRNSITCPDEAQCYTKDIKQILNKYKEK